MKISIFPTCCAGRILSEFGNTSIAIDSTPYSEEQVDQFLQNYKNSGMFYIVALNKEQNQKLSSVFIKNGFRLIEGDIMSPGHPTSSIFLYLKAQKKR